MFSGYVNRYNARCMELLTIEEAAGELGLHYNTVYHFCTSGRLGQQVGRFWVISRDDLEAFKAIDRTPGRPRKTAPENGEHEHEHAAE